MKLALFGGTFDPVTQAHISIAQHAAETCQLDEVVFLPCWRSPFKQDTTPGATSEQRLEMLRLATEGESWAQVSDLEIQREKVSYSWETVEHYRKQFPDADLHWLLGFDQWNALGDWARSDFLAENLTFIVFPREGAFPQPRLGFQAVFLEGTWPGSATEIRARRAASESITGLTPEPVEVYIKRNRIYK